MSNVLVCVGAYAKTPYFITHDCCNIYSVEELCYYLYHNAYLLDDTFVTLELAEWLVTETELPQIAKEVRKLVGKIDCLSKLVVLLANEIGFYEEDEWRALLSEIGKSNKLTVEERRKVRADSFLREGKYALAMDEYGIIIRQSRLEQTKLRSMVYHNMGVCEARLFNFKRAAELFGKAYETYPSTESYVCMLSAMKLYMPPQDYLTYLSEHKESYEDSLEVERKCEFCKLDYERQPINKFFADLQGLKAGGAAYYDGICSMAEEIKEEYRDSMFRNRRVN